MNTTPLPLGIALSVLLLVPIGCGDDTSADDTTSNDGTTTATTTGPDDSTGTPGSTGTPPATDSTDGGSTDDGTTGDPPATSDDSTGNGTTGEAGLEIAGEWVEEFAPGETIDHLIDEAQWDQLASFGDSLFLIEAYDNDGRWIVAQSDGRNAFDPLLYNRYNWTWDGEDLYYCTAAFGLETAQDAMDAPDADPGDLAAGCGGFGWSLLTPAM